METIEGKQDIVDIIVWTAKCPLCNRINKIGISQFYRDTCGHFKEQNKNEFIFEIE